MSSELSIGIYALSGLIAACSQMILKKTAMQYNGRSWIVKYLNIRIIIAYSMLLLTLFMNMIALRYMPYKYAPILSTLSYIFVLFLSKSVLKERISHRQMVGAMFIFGGIVLFHAG